MAFLIKVEGQCCGTCEHRSKNEWPSVKALREAPIPYWANENDRSFVSIYNGTGCKAWSAGNHFTIPKNLMRKKKK